MNRRQAIGVCSVGIGITAGCVSPLPKRLFNENEAHSPGGFNADQLELIALLADTIIPDTDTPGASAAGVVPFIEKLVFEWLNEQERAEFLAGLRGFMSAAERLKSQPFIQLGPRQRADALIEIAAPGFSSKGGRDAAASFYERMRSFTIYGYYTSEVGATQELHYNLAAAQYEPCRSIGSDERAPALDRLNFRLPAGR